MTCLRILPVLIRKEFALFRRDRAAVPLAFLVPAVLIFLFGEIFGLRNPGSAPGGVPVAAVNHSDHPAAERIMATLAGEPLLDLTTSPELTAASDGALREMVRKDRFRFTVILSPGDSAGGLRGLNLRILGNPRNAVETQTFHAVLQRAVISGMPEMLGAPTSGGAGGESLLSRLVKVENEQVTGATVQSPGAASVVGGWAVMFLLFSLTISSTSIFEERKAGLYQRMLSGTVTRSHLVLGKFCWGVLLGIVQLLTLFFTGQLLFGLDVSGHLPALLLICTAAAAACTAFGLLIASVTTSAESARSLATFLILVMSALGGAWFPISLMPEFIQQIAKLTLVFWTMEGFTGVLWAGRSTLEILPCVGILALTALIVMLAAQWRFRRSRVFE